MREQFAAMWFGPKGFASVVYGLLVLASGIAAADELFHLVALTIVLSILAHSSTDVLIARTFDDDHLPAWRDRLHSARRRLRRASTAPGRHDKINPARKGPAPPRTRPRPADRGES
jgi:NhaP-type Na+/H+ or K+/H+ antiporter